MHLQEALSIYKQDGSKADLKYKFEGIVENISAKTISQNLKNKNLSGSPDAGTFEANRIVNSKINKYGTARKAGEGAKVKIKPIYVYVNQDTEIIHEIEQKDLTMGNIKDVPARKMANDELSFTRELEKDFFSVAAGAGRVFKTETTDTADKIEEALQAMETTENEFIDGIERDMMTVICNTSEYGKLRKYLDTNVHNSNVDTSVDMFEEFHGAKVTKSIYLPKGVDFIVYVQDAVAQPVRFSMSDIDKIPFSQALEFGAYMYYGTTAVAPDTLLVATNGKLTLTSTAGVVGKTVMTSKEGFLRGAKLFYRTAASVADLVVGEALPASGYNLWDGEVEIAATAGQNIVIAEVNDEGNVVRFGKVASVVVGA